MIESRYDTCQSQTISLAIARAYFGEARLLSPTLLAPGGLKSLEERFASFSDRLHAVTQRKASQ